ncbi:MAG TPA: hypothetical protein VEX86_09825 [Longimicrobium sp.]|nr:hypothetical protein [Longimicrobium sp.]
MAKASEQDRARVFISCGQQQETSEVEIAHRVAAELRELGYEPYIGVAEQTLHGVQENIFRKLRESEYLLFIDFRRERLEGRDACRGSLFSHQELALATYLQLEILAFREDGVLPEDGVMKYLQVNCFPFSDRRTLPEFIYRKVQQHPKWQPHWRNRFALTVPPSAYEDPHESNPRARYFYIEVHNLHRDQIARECVAYVTRIDQHESPGTRTLELYEMKWKGVSTVGVSIPSGMARSLDAFYVYFHRANEAWLGINHKIVDRKATFEDFALRGPGVFDLHLVVCSANLPPYEGDFRLTLGSSMDDIGFERIGG